MPPQIEKTVPLNENENTEQLSSEDDEKNVSNIPKYLLILLLIQWFVFAITLTVGIYSIVFGNSTDILSGFQSLIPIIVLTIYYTFGLLVTRKQHQIGLCIFGSIGVILFIAVFIFVAYIILAITALSVGFGTSGSETYEFIGFLIILATVVAIVQIVTIKLTFDLAKSIKTNEYSTV